jgi:DNA-binding transcriptional LysR family regulator
MAQLQSASDFFKPRPVVSSVTKRRLKKKWQVPKGLFAGIERSSQWQYRQAMELRDLEAFVAVATELHFGRAANRLHMGTPSLSELIRRLERELGTPLFTRTTRRVAITTAGEELLGHAKTILDEATSAKAAVNRVATGEAGTVRVGVTPPVAPTLGPHLVEQFSAEAPNVTVDMQRMWLPNLKAALGTGEIDVAITCGLIPELETIASEVFCAEPLLVGLRPEHPLATRDTIELADLAHEMLGVSAPDLFPAWALAERQALETAKVDPRTVVLADTDLAAARWIDQAEVNWILLTPSLARSHTGTAIRPIEPPQLVPFTLQWAPDRAHTRAVARFVHTALTAELPAGWHTQPGHLGHDPTRA